MKEDFIKITNAAYKIIDFFPDSDPLKNKTKERVLSILENLTVTFDTQGWASLKKEKAAYQVLDDIEILENYLKLAKYQGWIDTVNFLILMKEYQRIKNDIQPLKGSLKDSLELVSLSKSDTHFITPEGSKLPPLPQNDKKESYNSDRLVVKEEPSLQNGKQTDRQKKIIQMLEEKEKAQVADIIKELPTVTKRTIRRDLDDLLKRGKIARIGEWNQVFYQIKDRT